MVERLGPSVIGARLRAALEGLEEPEEAALVHARTVAGCAGTGRQLQDIVRWLHDVLEPSDIELFSARTRQGMRQDLQRLATRLGEATVARPGGDELPERLHLGCGRRRFEGWLNVDVAASDHDVDLAAGTLPWPSDHFEAVVSLHVIEHLDLETELLPMLVELHRVCRPGAEVWIGCPDLGALCTAYCEDRCGALERERRRYWPGYAALVAGGLPSQAVVNQVFHQWGEHRNLFDVELLTSVLARTGFEVLDEVREADLTAFFPEVPMVGYEDFTLFVRARCDESRDPGAFLHRLRVNRRRYLEGIDVERGGLGSERPR